MRKLVVILSILVLTFSSVLTTEAEEFTPVEGDKYYKYVDRYLNNKPDDVHYTFTRIKWIQKHHDDYVSKLNKNQQSKFKDYVFSNAKVDKNGKFIEYENKIVLNETWKRNSRSLPQDSEEYLIVNIDYEEEGVRINKIRDIWWIEIEQEKEYKPDCDVKFRKDENGKTKRHVTCKA